MNFQRLEYFYMVAKLLNFSKAAEQLYVSRQALSKQITLLEEEYGARLLERDTVHVVLTEVGKKVLELYEPVSYTIRQYEEAVHAFVEHKKTNIRVGYFNGLPYRKVVAPVTEFIATHIPDAVTTIMALDFAETQQLLIDDQIDLLISIQFEDNFWPGVKYIPIATPPSKIIVSEYHPWYQKDHVTAEDLTHASFVCYENSSGPDKSTFMRNMPVKERVYVRNVGTYNGILDQGTAFGIVSDFHSQSETGYRLFDLPPEYPSSGSIIVACKPLHPRVEIFEGMAQLLAEA